MGGDSGDPLGSHNTGAKPVCTKPLRCGRCACASEYSGSSSGAAFCKRCRCGPPRREDRRLRIFEDRDGKMNRSVAVGRAHCFAIHPVTQPCSVSASDDALIQNAPKGPQDNVLGFIGARIWAGFVSRLLIGSIAMCTRAAHPACVKNNQSLSLGCMRSPVRIVLSAARPVTRSQRLIVP